MTFHFAAFKNTRAIAIYSIILAPLLSSTLYQAHTAETLNMVCGRGADITRGCEAIRARKIVDASKYPWSAIGRVNFAGTNIRKQCTGVLISDRLVLTAAHCLYNRLRKKWLRPQSIHFVAGYQRGNYAAASAAIGYTLSSTHNTNSRIFSYKPKDDWALVELKKPIGTIAGYLGWSALGNADLKKALRSGAKTALAGYPAIRKHVLSLNNKCGTSGLAKFKGLLTHQCAAMQGDSGAPVLLIKNGKPIIIGTHSGTIIHQGKAVQLAVPLVGFYTEILKASPGQLSTGAAPGFNLNKP